MCNHVYTADYKSAPVAMGKRCPYPEFYASLAAAGGASAGQATLPVDHYGVCLFHSKELDWKRANDFSGTFLGLVHLLDEHGTEWYYDFAEFVFVGSEMAAESGSTDYLLRIVDTTFQKQARFTAAQFTDMLEVERVTFVHGAEFDEATFARDLTITDAYLNGAGMNRARFQRAWFIRVEFAGYALFECAQFTGASNGGYAVRFQDSVFRGLTSFSNAVFELRDDSTASFDRVKFAEFTDFRGTRFNCHTGFQQVTFSDIADFIDTQFEIVSSSARYVGAAAEFTDIKVPGTGALTFRSTDPGRKLFAHDVYMSFDEEELAGTVQFENVNLVNFVPASRPRVLELGRQGKVQIGAGCIKYRLQTEVRTVPVDPENAQLVVELCQTFTSYFTASHGLNLGFEIVARDRAKIRFFYFSDEDIPYSVFLERLADTEGSLWNLLSVGSDAQLLALAARGQTTDARGESVLINAVDGLSALLGTFFRVGARIALGRWQAADTLALLGAIRFNPDGAELRAGSLHQTLVDRYTGTTLIALNRGQNALLPEISTARQTHLARGKVRILFLGANSAAEPLDLEREVSRIDTQLKLARERDVELKPVWAVTIDALIQAMLDEQPEVVHFSGHGAESGIILRDEVGAPRSVSGEALAKLFGLFRETVQCVVLNSCYSEVQATAIRRHIPFVVGIRAAIKDEAAVAFSTGFYTAIAAGKDIPFAFEIGKTRMRMKGTGGEDLLTLL